MKKVLFLFFINICAQFSTPERFFGSLLLQSEPLLMGDAFEHHMNDSFEDRTP
jgi:hypothetical protein